MPVKQSYQELLHAEITKSIENLALLSRMLVDNFSTGQHVSNGLGSGVQFNQYRNYEVGDDLRMLDWKLFARSNRFYIKQSEIESNTTVKFIIDNSKSMKYAEGALSKLDYAKIIVAALAKLCEQQNDAFGLYAVSDQHLLDLLPRHHKQQYLKLLNVLVNLNATGKWPSSASEVTNLHNSSQKELIFVITDFYEYVNELTETILQLKTTKNEVVVLHLMHKNEMEFSYNSNITFEDLETGNKIKVNTKAYKEEYINKVQQNIKSNEAVLLSKNISYHLFRLDEPLENTLQLFLKKRRSIH